MIIVMPSTMDAVAEDEPRVWRPEPLIIKLGSRVTRIYSRVGKSSCA